MLALAAMMVFGLAGCDTLVNASHAEHATDVQQALIEKSLAQGNPASHEDDTVQYMTHQYVSLLPILEPRQETEPPFKCHIAIGTLQPISLQELAQTITRKCGIPVRITQDALAQLAKNPGAATTQGASATATTPAMTMPMPMMVPAIQGKAAGVSVSDNLVDVNFDGEVDDLLNMVMARLGLSYTREVGANGLPSVKIFAIQTKTFQIHMIGGDINMQSMFDSGTTQQTGASSGAGGSSSSSSQGQSNTLQHVQSTLKGSIWDEMTASLKKMGNVTTEPMSGTVTVTDTADVIERVKDYVDAKNKMFDKFVTFQINVYSVTLTSSDSLGLSWNLVWQTLAGKGFTLANTFTAPTGAVSGGYSVLSSSTSPFAGTSAMLSALNTLGKAKLTRSTAVPALNLTMAASQTGTQAGYLQASSTSQTANVGSTASLTPGTINTGFNISLLPDVLEDNSMILKFQVNLSTNEGIRTVSADGSELELPTIGLPLNTAETVPLQPGQALMLTGQDYDDESSDRSGVGSAWNFLAGGGISASKTRTLMVVMITPILSQKSSYAYR